MCKGSVISLLVTLFTKIQILIKEKSDLGIHSLLLHDVQVIKESILNPIAVRMAKTPWSFGRHECSRVKHMHKAKLIFLKTYVEHFNILVLVAETCQPGTRAISSEILC